LKLPDDIHQLLVRRFQNRRREWLAAEPGENQWPMEIALGIPTEPAALRQVEGVRAWVTAWQHWQGIGTLSWSERRWKALGVQRLPDKLVLQGPKDVALWIGEATRWDRAQSRYQALSAHWPALARHLPKHFDVLADYGDVDFRRLTEMLDWIVRHPKSNLYPRQIPVAGVDSKWLESRQGLVSELVAAIQGDPTGDRDFFGRCGLRALPQSIRMRVLDPELRSRLGGLGDISAPWEDVARLGIQPAQVFIVENLQTGLAFDDLAGAVVIMRLGYAVDVLGRIPWLRQARCIYWGDVDTHGFAILNRARAYLPGLETVLMDESTLMDHRDSWVEEKDPHASIELPLLTRTEQELYLSIKSNIYGQQVRLEQERIPWDMAWKTIQAIIR
jgi:hypothetical protein